MKTKIILQLCTAFFVLALVASPITAECGTCAAKAAAAQTANAQQVEGPSLEELRNAVTGLQAQQMNMDALLEGIRLPPEEALQEVVRNRGEVQAGMFRNLAQNVQLRAGELKADNQTFENVRLRISTRLSSRDVNIEIGADDLSIVDAQWRVRARELVLNESRLFYGNHEIMAAPGRAVEVAGVTPDEIELTLEDGKPAYALRYRVQRKLFGLFDVAVTKTAVLDASQTSPALTRERTPFWYFLTTEATE